MYNSKKYIDSVSMGKSAEELFVSIAKSKNYTVNKSTLHQDKTEHWDYEIIKTINNSFHKRKIDVKSLRKINRSDAAPSDKLILIELQNVGGGTGWLYGKADGFAFQLIDSFILIGKTDLQTKVESLIDINKESITTNSNKKAYIIYDRKRWNNNDRFVYITKEDLLSIKNKTIWKI